MPMESGWSAKRVLLTTAVCLAVGYPLFQYWMLRCPAVRGVVVDLETGKPIAGAEVQKAGEGPFLLSVEANVHAFGASASHRTDSEGRFRFPAKCAASNVLDFLLPLQWINSVSLSVYTPEHITSQVREDVWGAPGSVRYVPKGDGWSVYQSQYAVFKRRSLSLRGYEYRIELQKARDEKEWQEKCRVTHQAMCFDQDTQDRWVFNDLTAYLELWPEGEKAGEYYKLLWETANLVPCNKFEQEDFARGRLTRERLQTYCDRATKIIVLSESLDRPPGGLTEDYFNKTLEEEKRQLACGKELLGPMGKKKNGGRQ